MGTALMKDDVNLLMGCMNLKKIIKLIANIKPKYVGDFFNKGFVLMEIAVISSTRSQWVRIWSPK